MSEKQESLSIDRSSIKIEWLKNEWYILEEREKWKYDVSFDMTTLFTNDQIKDIKEKYPALMKIDLLAYWLTIDQISDLSKLIKRLLNDSKWWKLYIDESFLNKFTTTDRFDDYDIYSDKWFLSSLLWIAWREEIEKIVWWNNIDAVMSFINEIIERRNVINWYLESKIKKTSANARKDLSDSIV